MAAQEAKYEEIRELGLEEPKKKKKKDEGTRYCRTVMLSCEQKPSGPGSGVMKEPHGDEGGAWLTWVSIRAIKAPV